MYVSKGFKLKEVSDEKVTVNSIAIKKVYGGEVK